MFGISLRGFFVIALLIYSIVFIGTIVSFLKYRNNLNGKKIMILGIGLIILAIGFFTILDFKVNFPLLNFLTLLLGVVLLFVGFCYKD
jgi:hypothetical protein